MLYELEWLADIITMRSYGAYISSVYGGTVISYRLS